MLRAACLLGCLAVPLAEGCTTIAVSAKASAHGSTMTTHTNDCATCDTRVAYIYPRDWPEGSTRPIYPAQLNYPRFVGDRSPTYAPLPGQVLTQPMGHIPQVPHTYGYWEAGYGYINEHGLTLGESTCAAKFSSTNATALLSITELTRLAMERCMTARCAASTMGGLAEEKGFLNEDPGTSGGGESLTLADGAEAWVFHITSGPGGHGAFWVAKQVPEGHVALVANDFVIREVDCDDATFLCSTELLGRAAAAGVYSGVGKFDWMRSMGEDIMTYSYFQGFAPIPEYTSGRLWRVQSRIAPSLGLKMEVNPRTYPFSVQVDKKLTARDTMDLMRDHYEGTELDLTKGVFAGPFGSPNRQELGVGMSVVKGKFARAISLHRTATAIVGESYGVSGNGMSKVWLGMDAPASSVFVPFYANTTRYAAPFRTGYSTKYDEKSAWWAFTFVANWMDLNYVLMKVDVDAKIAELQDEIDGERAAVELRAAAEVKQGRPGPAFDALEEFQTVAQQRVFDAWREFGHFLVMKYNDAYLNYPALGTHIGYPAWWLEMNGFDENPRPKWTEPQPQNEEPPLFKILGPGPFETLTPALQTVASSNSIGKPLRFSAAPAVSGPADATGAVLLTLLAAVPAAFAVGLYAGRRTGAPRANVAEWGASPYIQVIS